MPLQCMTVRSVPESVDKILDERKRVLLVCCIDFVC
jgi:hypothetical protein